MKFKFVNRTFKSWRTQDFEGTIYTKKIITNETQFYELEGIKLKSLVQNTVGETYLQSNEVHIGVYDIKMTHVRF